MITFGAWRSAAIRFAATGQMQYMVLDSPKYRSAPAAWPKIALCASAPRAHRSLRAK
jgi:hypothetical protein